MIEELKVLNVIFFEFSCQFSYPFLEHTVSEKLSLRSRYFLKKIRSQSYCGTLNFMSVWRPSIVHTEG